MQDNIDDIIDFLNAKVEDRTADGNIDKIINDI